MKLATFSKYIKELEETVTHGNKVIHPYLPHINSFLHNAVLTCRAALESQHAANEDLPNFEGEAIPPGKRMEHQWTFKKTEGAPGRKKKGMVLR